MKSGLRLTTWLNERKIWRFQQALPHGLFTPSTWPLRSGSRTGMKSGSLPRYNIKCVDGLKGFPEAIHTVFPETEVQLCIVQLIRSSTRQVSWAERKPVTRDLKPIYTAPTAEAAEQVLAEFDKIWGGRYPMIAQAWQRVWLNVVPFFKFPPDIRRAVYTTNAIESVNASIRHITKNRNLFPNDDAVFKLLHLALTNTSKKWTVPIRQWWPALQQFAVFFPGRVPLNP